MPIQDTAYGKSFALEAQAIQAFPYLVKHGPSISLSAEELRAIVSLRGFTPSLMLDLFRKIVETGSIANNAMFNLQNTQDSIPDILTFDEISIDGKYIPNAPHGFDRPWINVTTFMGKRVLRSDPIVIRDITKTCEHFVRATLCAGYNDKSVSVKETWLSPILEVFVVESYSMTIALLLQRVFNLNINETRVVQTLFAYFYARRLNTFMLDGDIPAILNRCSFLGSINGIRDIINHIREVAQTDLNDLTIFSVCDIAAKVGPERMSKFTANILIRGFTASALDSASMSLAMDYPPYWVFQLLRYLSGAKNYIIGQTFTLPSLKRDSLKFGTAILAYRGLIHTR